MSLNLKKRIDLESLGEQYKDSYLIFRAISVREYGPLANDAKRLSEDGEKSLKFLLEQLETRFVEGKFNGQDLSKEDIGDFGPDVIIECFNQMRGDIGPKV